MAKVKGVVKALVDEFLEGYEEDLQFDQDTRLFDLLDNLIKFLASKFPSWPVFSEDHHEAGELGPGGTPGTTRR